MWDGWVDTEKDQTYIIGHWNYPDNTVKPVQVVSTGEEVELFRMVTPWVKANANTIFSLLSTT